MPGQLLRLSSRGWWVGGRRSQKTGIGWTSLFGGLLRLLSSPEPLPWWQIVPWSSASPQHTPCETRTWLSSQRCASCASHDTCTMSQLGKILPSQAKSPCSNSTFQTNRIRKIACENWPGQVVETKHQNKKRSIQPLCTCIRESHSSRFYDEKCAGRNHASTKGCCTLSTTSKPNANAYLQSISWLVEHRCNLAVLQWVVSSQGISPTSWRVLLDSWLRHWVWHMDSEPQSHACTGRQAQTWRRPRSGCLALCWCSSLAWVGMA